MKQFLIGTLFFLWVLVCLPMITSIGAAEAHGSVHPSGMTDAEHLAMWYCVMDEAYPMMDEMARNDVHPDKIKEAVDEMPCIMDALAILERIKTEDV